MNDGKYADYKGKSITRSPSEVRYTNQSYEFKAFYKNHYALCGAISGTNKIMLQTGDFDFDQILISKSNFDLALKRLEAFFYQNYIYFSSNVAKRSIETKIDDLTDKFLDDDVYHNLIEKIKSLGPDDLIRLEMLYMGYIIECFNVLEEICLGLQKTILLSPRTIEKIIKFNSDNIFFEQLSVYRDRVETILSNFTFKKLPFMLRFVMSYSQTYRYLLDPYQTKKIDEYILLGISYYTNPEILNLIEHSKNDSLSIDMKKRVRKETKFIKKILGKIYTLTSQGLSDRGILPKISKRINYDRSTM